MQVDDAAQIRAILQQRRDLAIIAAAKLLERQDGEELMLGKLPGTEPVCILRQRILGNCVGRQQHLPWRLAGLVHPASSNDDGYKAQPTCAEHDMVFYGAGHY